MKSLYDDLSDYAIEILRTGSVVAKLCILVRLVDRLPPNVDCGDSACLAASRRRGGMRTNGGCRCDKLVIAADRLRAVLSFLDAPSMQRELDRRGK